MPKITRIPAALLRRSDSQRVADGDVLPGSTAEKQVRLRGALPDADGLVTVETRTRVKPEDYGLYVRPGKVTVELTDDEANTAAGITYSNLGLYADAPTPAAPALTVPEPEVAAAPETAAAPPFPDQPPGGPASTG